MHLRLIGVVQRLKSAKAERELTPLAKAVRKENLTYLGPLKLASLERWAREAARLDADFVECGIALGGSGLILADHTPPQQVFHGYDVFGMIPPPDSRDTADVHERYAVIASGRSEGVGGETYYGYRNDLYEQVARNFARHGHPVGDRVMLHRGLFEHTLFPSRPVALAHIDSDWYGAVSLCLERIHPHLVPGGIIILDDYFTYGSARNATDEFLSRECDLRVVSQTEHLVLQRQ